MFQRNRFGISGSGRIRIIIILSRLNYCIELVSQGRKEDLERLQSAQSKAARWVLQTRKRDWSLSGGLKKLGWLSMAQQAAYVSLTTAFKVLQKGEPERLYDLLTEEKNQTRMVKVINENKFKKLKATTRKAWSYRSLRWLEQMPDGLRRKDVNLKATKIELKEWVIHHVPVRGDRILWGKPLTGEMRRRTRAGTVEAGGGGPDGHHQEDLPTRNVQNAAEERRVQDGGEIVIQQSYQGPIGNNSKWLKKVWLGMLLLVLAGRDNAAAIEVMCKESLKGTMKQEEICQSSVKNKLLFYKKKTGSQGCGGHRGGTFRVKSGEG